MAFAWFLASFRSSMRAGCALAVWWLAEGSKMGGCPRQKLPSGAQKCHSQQAGFLATSPELVGF